MFTIDNLTEQEQQELESLGVFTDEEEDLEPFDELVELLIEQQ